MAIIQAILAGERDRYKLADLADVDIQATREEIARSLEGNWRNELLFILRQELNLYQIYQPRRRRFPGSRGEAYYLMSIHEWLPKQVRSQLKEVGWSKATELAKVAARAGLRLCKVVAES